MNIGKTSSCLLASGASAWRPLLMLQFLICDTSTVSWSSALAPTTQERRETSSPACSPPIEDTGQVLGLNLTFKYTREETHMEPEHGPWKDYFPLQPRGFQVPCGSLPGCTVYSFARTPQLTYTVVSQQPLKNIWLAGTAQESANKWFLGTRHGSRWIKWTWLWIH